jgi:hypothetical protein
MIKDILTHSIKKCISQYKKNVATSFMIEKEKPERRKAEAEYREEMLHLMDRGQHLLDCLNKYDKDYMVWKKLQRGY